MSTIKQLQEKRARAYNAAKDIRDRIKNESRALSADEKEAFDKAMKEFDELTATMRDMERLEDVERQYDDYEFKEEVLERTAKAKEVNPQAEKKDSPEQRYENFFWKEMRYGNGLDPNKMKELLKEFRGTNVIATETSTTYGGYLVPTTLWNELDREMKAFGGMLQASRIINTNDGGTFNYPTNNDTLATGNWLSEPRSGSLTVEDTTFSRVQYSAYTWGTLIKVSLEFVQDERVGFLSEVLTTMLGERAGRALNQAFTDGAGSTKPTGILDSSNGASTGKTTASASAITKAELFDLVHSVDPAYRMGPNVRWMFNDNTLNEIRQLDISTNTAPIWQPSFREGVPDTILGHPYTINQAFPSIASGADVAAFGDFSKYIIRQVQRPSMVALNERYMDELHRGFVMWCRYDGKLLNTSAIKLLTMN